MIFWALIFQVIEFVSGLVFFKLFIYEEISQAGTLYCFIAQSGTEKNPTEKIKQLTKIHGLDPGKATLNDTWMLAPWCYDTFGLFYKATEQAMEAFN